MSNDSRPISRYSKLNKENPFSPVQLDDRKLIGIEYLIRANNTKEYKKSLNIALKGGSLLTNSNVLAIYLADNIKPGANLIASTEDAKGFPDHIPIQDIMALREVYTWTPSSSLKTTLHRKAILPKLKHITSLPLGEEKAVIGLLVFASDEIVPSKEEIIYAKLVASTITSIIIYQTNFSKKHPNSTIKENDTIINNALTENIHEGFIVINSNNQITHINPSAEKMLGYSNKEITGQSVKDIIISNKEIEPLIRKVKLTNETIPLDNLQIYRRNGESFLATIKIFSLQPNNSQQDKLAILIQDLSEQEQIRFHAQQLEQRAFLGEITAIFAHEVRNPINNISTGLQLMALNLPPEDHNQKAIDRMQQECDRLETLMKSVLSFSRTTSYEMTSIQIPPIIKRILERAQTKMQRDNIEHTLQIDKNIPPVKGNMRALEQVFNNLINNAFQAVGTNGGKLAIKIQNQVDDENRDYVEVSIADNGPGIPEEIKDKLFSPFFTTKKKGSGLGLAITKRIIVAHNGMIEFDSFPGGTVFKVKIPALKL